MGCKAGRHNKTSTSYIYPHHLPHVEGVSSNLIELYKNSNYKVSSKVVKSIQHQENSSIRKGLKPAAGSSVDTSKLLEISSSSLSNNEGIAIDQVQGYKDCPNCLCPHHGWWLRKYLICRCSKTPNFQIYFA